jgi:8-amino-7-oxononanoate synthase
MLDFTSALYLGLQHPSVSLAPWQALTLGRPAVLTDPPQAEAVAGELARLQGSEAATLLPSTLHLFWDLFAVLGGKRRAIVCDAGLYPIARWGVERAACSGSQVENFPHHSVAALRRILDRLARTRVQPIVVTDGYCPSCGRPAPIRAYDELVRRAGGYLVIDDTQALGVLGDSPTEAHPYGTGGGGSLRWHQTYGPHIVVGSSLAKGFGAPLAALSGSRALIERFVDRSETRLHCSPPSVAAVHAARQALQINRLHGDGLRRKLLDLVRRLRHGLRAAGLVAASSFPFPVQSFCAERPPILARVFRWLNSCGVQALITRGCKAVGESVTFLLTARHDPTDIDVIAGAAAVAGRTHALGRVA